MPPSKPFHQYLIAWPPTGPGDKKTCFTSDHRTCSTEETLARIRALQSHIGITRIADVTGLDCVGIPTYNAIRPDVDYYESNITVYNGKGITGSQAEACALMEAIERFSAERQDRPTLVGAYDEFSKQHKAIPPPELILTRECRESHNHILEWIPSVELFASGETWIPAAAVFCPYRPKNAEMLCAFGETTGLASGNSIVEAIFYGLCEVIERDATKLAQLKGNARTIDLDSIDSSVIQTFLGNYAQAGIHVTLKEITSDLGIPTFFAATDDPNTQDPALICCGYGCHVNAEIAAIRAITEAAQSRCTLISGNREGVWQHDRKRLLGYDEVKQQLAYWLETTNPIKGFTEIPSLTHKTFSEDIEHIMGQLKKCHLNKVCVADLTSPQTQIPVVRVIVPGLEPPLDTGRHGQRAQMALAQRHS